jgi:hypothetical protein
MTTALLLVLPVIGMVALGVTAKFAIRSKAVQLESISSVWPTVLEALPPLEREPDEPVAVGNAA